jgi:hypothetical protein
MHAYYNGEILISRSPAYLSSLRFSKNLQRPKDNINFELPSALQAAIPEAYQGHTVVIP